MDKRLLFAAFFLLAGCVDQPQPSPHESVARAPITNGVNDIYSADVRTFHDDKHGATCWYMTGGYSGTSPAMSCLPDSQLKAPTHD